MRSFPASRLGRPALLFAIALGAALTVAATRPVGAVPGGDESGAGAAPSVAAAEPFPQKETLTYVVRVWKGFEGLGAEIGKGELTLERTKIAGRVVYSLDAEGKGGAFGYELQTHIKSMLARDGLCPMGYELDQKGNEARRYRMAFEGGKVTYRKWKHCNLHDCEDPAHIITVTRRRFWVGPKYTEKVHCDEDEVEDCDIAEHHFWQDRTTRDCSPGTYDMLSAIYIARTLDLKPGGEAKVVAATDRHDTWDVEVTPARSLDTVEMPDGTKRQALLLTLQPKPQGGSAGVRDEFRGLFGMHGALKIWVDPDTIVPVKILGIIPFGVNINCQVELVSEERTPSDAPKVGDF